MATFSDLVESRKEWIRTVLEPWCRQAALRDLRLAETEWTDIAGKVDPAATLWHWAWSRFPALIHDDLPGLNETSEIEITLQDGTVHRGYPDARAGGPGRLVLAASAPKPDQPGVELGPFAIDDIQSARRVDETI